MCYVGVAVEVIICYIINKLDRLCTSTNPVKNKKSYITAHLE